MFSSKIRDLYDKLKMNESVEYQSDKRGNWISSIIYVIYKHEMFIFKYHSL